MDDVFEAFQCCITGQRCAECPSEHSCKYLEDYRNENISIPKDLAEDVLNWMKDHRRDPVIVCPGCGQRVSEIFERMKRNVSWRT